MVNADRRLAKTNATDNNNNNNTKNTVKIKVKKNKVKTKSKSNAQRGVDNTRKDINMKKYKVRKRVKKNTDLTPKVAKNTKADAGKYTVLPNYAYRPADSPTHVLKSKNDLIALANQDIKKFDDQYLAADEEIQKVIKRRELAQNRAEQYKTTLRLELNKTLAAEKLEEQERLDFDKRKNELKAQHNDTIKNMQRKHYEEQELFKWNSKLHEAELDKKSEDAIHEAKMKALREEQELRNKKSEHAIDLHNTEQDLKRAIHDIEIKKLNTDAAKRLSDLQHELEKCNTRAQLEDAPEYKKLSQEYADAQAALRNAELVKQQEKMNKQLQQQIDDINHHRALLEAENKFNPKLKQELLRKQQELAQLKAEQSLVKDKAKVERKISEIHAQRGEAEKLQQQILDHKQQYDDIVAANNTKSEQLAQLKQEYSDYVAAANQLDQQTTAYRNAVAATYDKMKRHLTPDEQQAITTVDPTLALNRMLDIAQQRITTRGEYVDRALATANNIQRVFEHDPNLAKIGVTLTNVSQQLRDNQQAVASQHIPDFVTVQIEQPPPAVVESKFVSSFR